jgi:putative phage-type endonuclease
MDEWFEKNFLHFYDESKGFDYHEIKKSIEQLFELYYIHRRANILSEEMHNYEDPSDLIEALKHYGYEYLTFTDISLKEAKEHTAKHLTQIHDAILRVQNIPCQKQRSDEWFEFRKQHFTASDFYKIFSDKQLDTMIKKKLHPSKSYVKPTGAMKKGIIFEDVAVQIYEREHNCKVNEFGCIPHKTVKGLAASPDGIIIQPDSDKYGHMLEIKCVSSRIIDGVVPEKYWMQMQIQMEVCDLEYCDFLECLFLEKPVYEEWVEYIENTPKIKWYGILLEGVIDGETKYIYGDLNDKNYPEYPEKFITTQVHYWYLNTFSIQTIKRNREWFSFVLPRIHHAVQKLDEEREKIKVEDDADDESKPTVKKIKRSQIKRKSKKENITNFFGSKDSKGSLCMIDSD